MIRFNIGAEKALLSAVMAVVAANRNSLERLYLGPMQIDDDFVAFLSTTASKLKSLYVTSSDLTNKGLGALAGEKNRC